MIYTAQTKKAMQLAYRAHNGQIDKSGVPYLFHVIHVAEQMPDEHTTIAALLHDILEDTDVTVDDLYAVGFPTDVIDAVQLLTHDPTVPYLDYIRSLSSNLIAVTVKLADLTHNSDNSRFDTATSVDLQRRKKYQDAMALLHVPACTEVVAALIWNDKKFMICQRPAHKARGLLWEFVGGKVESGETKEYALIRECREELAVTVAVGDPFMDVTHVYPDIIIHLTLFHTSIRQGIPQLLEHREIRWITPQEIDAYSFCPADTILLDRLKHEYLSS